MTDKDNRAGTGTEERKTIWMIEACLDGEYWCEGYFYQFDKAQARVDKLSKQAQNSYIPMEYTLRTVEKTPTELRALGVE